MTIRIIAGILAFGLLSASCTKKVYIFNHPKHAHRLPPGQAKKVYGQQSAKEFAPGQQKKKKH